ncbi:hypothetical protein Ddc_07235 [Ditylenchus destructor]|nr:hypothetical protein Ddc_07235 [Ditylenchus destructor]
MSRRGREWVNTIAYNLRVKSSTSSGYCYREPLSNITMNAAETFGAVVLAMCSRKDIECVPCHAIRKVWMAVLSFLFHRSREVPALVGNEKEEMAQSTTVTEVNTSGPRVWVADANVFIWPEFSAYESSHKKKDIQELLYINSIWPIRQILPTTRSHK